ncbi:ATP-binding cassette domain-containing protein [uncultured Methylobacterium sp.]|jgi:peptide/nickel transport system ATP-binding protein|uniref:ABC transporter ATP-binding protein n=1 Tax=uncultured Methylobacterium sp. TaxID=157278 RepID=UPI002632A4D9|nr:ATP-binding cassette domain-containing protein [uncultured Methylobacterium sp.]
MMTALRIEDLTIRTADRVLVSGFSAAVGRGEPLTLLGESGSGKSLVAQAIMGTLPSSLIASGQIFLDGTDLLRLDGAARRTLWGRRIGLLPQEPWTALDPTMRAKGQLTEVHRYVHRRRDADSLAAAGLEEVGLADASEHYPFQMSGGMCQRLALAMAHAADTQVLLVDEPSKGLDGTLRADVVARLRREVAAGRLLLTITHDIALARSLGGTACVMLDGQAVETGPTARLLDAPTHAYTWSLIAADPSAWRPRAPWEPGPLVIEGTGLVKAFGRRRLFTDLSVRIGAGEIVAVVGPSGSGKTTLGNILVGTEPPDRGWVRRAPGAASVRFQKLYQDPPAAFVPHQTMGRALDHLVRRHGLDPERVEDLLARLKLLPGLRKQRPGELSGGELQRFALARVLLLNPVFLFADEATSRLDPVNQMEVAGLLREASERDGLAILFVTHDLGMAERFADRAIILH